MASANISAAGHFVEENTSKDFNGGVGIFVKLDASTPLVGTISFFVVDDADNEYPFGVYSYDADGLTTSITSISFAGWRNVVGAKRIRGRCTAFTSGKCRAEITAKAG